CPDDQVKRAMRTLWKSLTEKGSDKERTKLLVDLQEQARTRGDDPLSEKLLRGQVHRALLDVLAEMQDKGVLNLDRDREKVETLLDFVKKQLGDQERPAETHLLVMLLQDLARDHAPAGKILAQALRVRLQAEQAALAVAGSGHPYSEAVFAWVKSDVA